ncbi:hypothetical protein Pla8534_20700 [Lignipirellula cremea]|uniref:Uncharacterized protein n=2 Tax=Lignipirellula cremea TaxID=2528010 RepID=A0A518DR22_9BACT|nr:hypothetical protein Pla8534_20700 [Lignipirellula cremea]
MVMKLSQTGKSWFVLSLLSASLSTGCVSLPFSLDKSSGALDGVKPPDVQSAASLDALGDPSAPPEIAQASHSEPAAPPTQPPYNQDPYAQAAPSQTQFGSAPNGQYGQPQNGQYGQPQSGQPAPGQSQYGQQGQPLFGPLGQPLFGPQGQPLYGPEGQPLYDLQGRPLYGPQGQPTAANGHAQPQGPAKPSVYKITLLGISPKPQQKVLPLPKDMYLQDALEVSGAFKKYSRIKVSMVRSAPGESTRHKMEVFVSKNKVDELHNYLLHHGDHIVVEEDKLDREDIIENITSLFSF